MSRSLSFRVALAGAVAAVACASGDDRPRSPADSAALDVELTATDYAFDSPDTLPAGWTTFRLVNRGRQPHMGQLVRVEGGVSVDDYLAAYEQAFRTAGPRPESGRRLGGPAVAVPYATTKATLYLEPGQYLWICLFNVPDGIPHVVGHRMAEPFVVKPPSADPARGVPTADIDMQLTDYAFNVSSPLRPGRQVVRVRNSGTESHEVAVVKLLAGKSIEDVRAWARNPSESVPFDMRSGTAGITSLAPDTEGFFELDLAPGDYALFCLVTARDGRSHVDHGMIRHIRVG